MLRLPVPLSRRPGARPVLAALVAIFWLAQLHGLEHGISHLGAAPGMGDRGAPHTLVCTDCVASAEAGAAPVLAHSVPALAPSNVRPAALPAVASRGRLAAAAYLARGPPATSI